MMQEYFARTAMLLGEQAMVRLAAASVVVAGVGGVGSYTAEALARSGVGRLLLIDNDLVDPTNINRQLHATTATIGLAKAQVMAERLRSINPQLTVEVRSAFLLPENIPDQLAGSWDYIVDAIDTVAAKIALAVEAQRRGIPIISAMGAGNKLDPTRFVVGDLYETSVCPLCRVMRRELRKAGVAALQVVYSTEPPLTPAPPPGPGEAPQAKRQTPGSMAFVPGVAGLIAAGVVVRSLAGI